MVSYAPTTQSYLFNHMTFFSDYQSLTEPKMCVNKNSMYDFISQPQYSKFKKVVDTAQMMGILNDEQANLTLFVASNNSLNGIGDDFFNYMDNGLAKQIIKASSIPKMLARDLLTSSPVCYFYTKNPEMRMYTTNINNTTVINECVRVTEYDKWCMNGIIHIVDGLILPSHNHFMN